MPSNRNADRVIYAALTGSVVGHTTAKVAGWATLTAQAPPSAVNASGLDRWRRCKRRGPDRGSL